MDPIAKPQFTIDDKPPAEQIASSSGELRTIAGSAAVLIAIVLAILASGVWHASNEAIASGQLVNAIDSSQVVASTEQKRCPPSMSCRHRSPRSRLRHPRQIQ